MTATFRITCAHCSEPTRVTAQSFYRWWPDEPDTVAEVPENSIVRAAIASFCPECEGVVALVVKGEDRILRPIMAQDIEEKDWSFYEADLTLVSYFPNPKLTRLTEATPLEIREVFPDLLEAARRGKFAAQTTMMCGSVLEVALKHMENSITGEPLVKLPLMKRIDRLRDLNLLTKDIAEWAHNLRLDRNRSAHELHGDAVLAREYAGFLDTFLEVAFELPARIRALKAAANPDSPRPGRNQ